MKGTLKVTASGGKNPGANLKPMSKLAPKSSKRPMTRTDKEISDMADHSIEQGIKYQKCGGKVSKMAKGGKISEYGGKEKYTSKKEMAKHERAETPAKERMEKMAMGGMCRGMGAAKKGGNYSKAG